jgi:hypothetical protein
VHRRSACWTNKLTRKGSLLLLRLPCRLLSSSYSEQNHACVATGSDGSHPGATGSNPTVVTQYTERLQGPWRNENGCGARDKE